MLSSEVVTLGEVHSPATVPLPTTSPPLYSSYLQNRFPGSTVKQASPRLKVKIHVILDKNNRIQNASTMDFYPFIKDQSTL